MSANTSGGAAAGDPRGDLARLVDAHYERVYRLARVMSGNDADALDLAQETFLAVAKGLAGFRGEASVATWLVAILRRQFATQLRRRRVREAAAERMETPVTTTPEPGPAPDLGPALARLAEPVRTALVLFYYEGMDYAAIALALECPVGTVRSRLHEGRAQLRRMLQKEGEAPAEPASPARTGLSDNPPHPR
jgi:RNA polymerase sigma-70 factor (ECF subfamily)